MTLCREPSNAPTILAKALSHKYLAPVLRHWLTLLEEEEIPSLQEMDPTAFTYSLPYISLFDWDEERSDFRCRLAGESVSESHTSRFRDHFLTTLYNPELACSIRQKWMRAFTDKALLFVLSDFGRSPGTMTAKRVILPLRDTKSDAPVILSASYYDYDAAYHAEKHRKAMPEDYEYLFLNYEHLMALNSFAKCN